MTTQHTDIDQADIAAILRGELGNPDPDRGHDADDVLLHALRALPERDHAGFWREFSHALKTLWAQPHAEAMGAAMVFLRRTRHSHPHPDPEGAFACLLTGHDAAGAEAATGALGILVDHHLGDERFWNEQVRRRQRQLAEGFDYHVQQAYLTAWDGLMQTLRAPRLEWMVAFAALIRRLHAGQEFHPAELLTMLLAGNRYRDGHADGLAQAAAFIVHGYRDALSALELLVWAADARQAALTAMHEVVKLWAGKSNAAGITALDAMEQFNAPLVDVESVQPEQVAKPKARSRKGQSGHRKPAVPESAARGRLSGGCHPSSFRTPLANANCAQPISLPVG